MVTVNVYTTNVCPWCHKIMDWLKENKIKFKEINVQTNPAKQQELIEKTGQMAVPVTIIGKDIILGFDVGRLKKALKL